MIVFLRKHDAPPSLCVRSVYGGDDVADLRQGARSSKHGKLRVKIRSGLGLASTGPEKLSQCGSARGLVDLGNAMTLAFGAAQAPRQVDDWEILAKAAREHWRK
jgi:hypothetical protein